MSRDTHGPGIDESVAWWGDAAPSTGYVVNNDFRPAPTSGTTTITLSPCQAYIVEATTTPQLRYMEELATRTVTFSAGNGTYWLAARWDVSIIPGGWTGVTGTHYAWILSPTMPIIPDGTALLSSHIVSAGAVTSCIDESTRLISTPQTITVSLTTSVRSKWIFRPGGRFILASGVILTHHGLIMAGRYRIFDTSSGGGAKITLPRGGTVFPEWWGAVPDDSTPSAAAINEALTVNPTNVDVSLDAGIYRIEAIMQFGSSGTGASVESGSAIRGNKEFQTILRRTTTFLGPILQMNDMTSTTFILKTLLSDFTIDGIDRAAGTIGIRSYVYGDAVTQNLIIRQCDYGWYAAGTYVTVAHHNMSLFDNGDGMFIDSVSVTTNGTSGIQFYGGRWRNNWRNSFYIKNSPDAVIGKRSRTITFIGTVFEGTNVTTGLNAAMRLENVESLHIIGCHFEQHAPHIHISGNGPTFPCRNISLINCNFGNVHAMAINPQAFLWNGDNTPGVGSYIEGSLIGAFGTWELNHTGTVFEVRTDLLGGVVMTGRFTKQHPWVGISNYITKGETTLNTWLIERVEKPESTHGKANFDRRFLSATTTDATPMTIAVFSDEVSLPLDGGLSLVLNIAAKQVSNANHARYGKTALFRNIAGVVSKVGDTQDLHNDIESNPAMNATIILASNAAVIQVVGLAEASPIVWYGTVDVIRMSPPV